MATAANGEPFGPWQCLACTLENGPSELRCAACDALRPRRDRSRDAGAVTSRSRPFNVFAYDSGSLLQLFGNVLGGGLIGGFWSLAISFLTRGRLRLGVVNMASLGVIVGSSYSEMRRSQGELWTVQDPSTGEIRRVPRELVSDGVATYQEIFGVEESIVEMMRSLPSRRLRSKRDVNDIPEHSKVCCICMEGYRMWDETKIMPCEHVFHAACIERWLVRAAVCPLCNYSLLERS